MIKSEPGRNSEQVWYLMIHHNLLELLKLTEAPAVSGKVVDPYEEPRWSRREA
jgi:hypothetical protein